MRCLGGALTSWGRPKGVTLRDVGKDAAFRTTRAMSAFSNQADLRAAIANRECTITSRWA